MTTTFSPITGYGPDPSLGAAPTTTPPVTGSSANGVSYYAPMPPAPMGGGALPNAAVPTGFDPIAYPPAGGGGMMSPPVTDMGVVGPPTTASAYPTSATNGIVSGGPQAASGWNADYGNAFARAFMSAGVSPSTTSAALHSLAAQQPTQAELEEALQYLSSPQGMQDAPYLAENLAKAAPEYGALGDTGSYDPAMGVPDLGDPTAYPPGMDPSQAGPLTVTGQTEDGRPVLSDGSTVVQDNGDGTYTTDTGAIIDDQGNILQPGDPNAVPQDPSIDPETGLPVDPNAADAGETPPPAEEKHSNPLPGILGLGVAGIAGGWGIHKWRQSRKAKAAGAVDGGKPQTIAQDLKTRAEIKGDPARAPGEVKPQKMPPKLQEFLEAQRRTGGGGVPHTPGTVPAGETAGAKPNRILFNGKPMFEPSSGPFRRGASRAAGAPGADIPIIRNVNPVVAERDAQAAARAFAQDAMKNKLSAGVSDALKGAVSHSVEADAGKLLRFASKL